MSSLRDDFRTNAYVDGELDAHERAVLLEELASDPARSREVAELGELKKLVRLAFERPPDAPPGAAAGSPRSRATRAGLRRALGCAFALTLIAAAFGAGWLAHSNGGLEQRLVALGGVQLAARDVATPGVLLHLASFHGKDVEATLHRAQELLERYRSSGLKVEVVVNGMALQFLQSDFFPYSNKFAQLMRRYPNLRIVACAETLDALGEQGRSLSLLKGVNVAPSAVQEVVKRLREGWVYVEA